MEMDITISTAIGIIEIANCDYTPGDPPSRDEPGDGGGSSPGPFVELETGEVTTLNVFVLDYAVATMRSLWETEQRLLYQVHAACEDYAADNYDDCERG